MDAPEQPMSEKNLTPHETTLLGLLRSRPGAVVSKEDIAVELYKDGERPQTNTVEVFIGRLRRKLKLSIKSRRGEGYVLVTL